MDIESYFNAVYNRRCHSIIEDGGVQKKLAILFYRAIDCLPN